jgi:toxin ParE1/3/4
MSKYTLTRIAETDIDEILNYISSDNLEASLAFYERLLELIRMLGENPNLGRERGQAYDRLRSFPLGNYIIFYRVWAGDVAIVRVVHGSRDLDELIG